MPIIRGNLRPILLTLGEIHHENLTDYEFRLYCIVAWRIENGLKAIDSEWPKKEDKIQVEAAIEKFLQLSLLEAV